jgi:hypothetical protein
MVYSKSKYLSCFNMIIIHAIPCELQDLATLPHGLKRKTQNRILSLCPHCPRLVERPKMEELSTEDMAV